MPTSNYIEAEASE